MGEVCEEVDLGVVYLLLFVVYKFRILSCPFLLSSEFHLPQDDDQQDYANQYVYAIRSFAEHQVRLDGEIQRFRQYGITYCPNLKSVFSGAQTCKKDAVLLCGTGEALTFAFIQTISVYCVSGRVFWHRITDEDG